MLGEILHEKDFKRVISVFELTVTDTAEDYRISRPIRRTFFPRKM